MVNVKVLPAYENQSSMTVRLTPEAIGKLLASVPDGDLQQVFDSVTDECVFTTAERRKVLSDRLFECAECIESKDIV